MGSIQHARVSSLISKTDGLARAAPKIPKVAVASRSTAGMGVLADNAADIRPCVEITAGSLKRFGVGVVLLTCQSDLLKRPAICHESRNNR